MEIIDESGAKTIEQKVTHALHSGFDRTIADHFISCYLLLKEWGCVGDDVCVAGRLHASYRRRDAPPGGEAVRDAAGVVGLGAGAEELIYLFPSAHKTAYASDKVLHAPLGYDDLLPRPPRRREDDHDRRRAARGARRARGCELARPEFPLQRRPGAEPVAVLSARDDACRCSRRAPAATIRCSSQRAFCARRGLLSTSSSGTRGASARRGPDAKWQKHIEILKPGGRYYDIEKILLSFVDEDGYTGDGCDAFRVLREEVGAAAAVRLASRPQSSQPELAHRIGAERWRRRRGRPAMRSASCGAGQTAAANAERAHVCGPTRRPRARRRLARAADEADTPLRLRTVRRATRGRRCRTSTKTRALKWLDDGSSDDEEGENSGGAVAKDKGGRRSPAAVRGGVEALHARDQPRQEQPRALLQPVGVLVRDGVGEKALNDAAPA